MYMRGSSPHPLSFLVPCVSYDLVYYINRFKIVGLFIYILLLREVKSIFFLALIDPV